MGLNLNPKIGRAAKKELLKMEEFSFKNFVPERAALLFMASSDTVFISCSRYSVLLRYLKYIVSFSSAATWSLLVEASSAIW